MQVGVVVFFVLFYIAILSYYVSKFDVIKGRLASELRKLGYSNISIESYGLFSMERQAGRYKVHYVTPSGETKSQDVHFQAGHWGGFHSWNWLTAAPENMSVEPVAPSRSKEAIIDALSAENATLRGELAALRGLEQSRVAQ